VSKHAHVELLRAYTQWDRSTAYMCRIRGAEYDDAEQRRLKAVWDTMREEQYE
jgi:hypothetical protein